MRASSDDPKRRLRDLLEQRITIECDSAMATGGAPRERLDALERLGRLVELSQHHAARGRRAWWIVGATAITAAIATVLLRHMPWTEVALTADVRALGFRVTGAQPLTEPVVLSTLAVSGLRNIVLPSSSVDAPNIAFTAVDSGTISLAPVILQTGSPVWITKTNWPSGYRLTLDSAVSSMRVAVDGDVQVTARGTPRAVVRYPQPQRIRLRPDARSTLSLELGPTSSWHDEPTGQIVSDLSIDRLSLSHIEHFAAGPQDLSRPVSSIVKGTLYFESLDGQPLSLRPSETVDIGVSRGDLLGLNVGRTTISFVFRGRVHTLRVGAGASTRNVMPTLLDWLRSRHSIWLLWGAVVYLFGLYGTIRGFRKDG